MNLDKGLIRHWANLFESQNTDEGVSSRKPICSFLKRIPQIQFKNSLVFVYTVYENCNPIEDENTLTLSKDFIDSCLNYQEDETSYGDFLYSAICFFDHGDVEFEDSINGSSPEADDWIVEQVNNVMQKHGVEKVLAIGVTKDCMKDLCTLDIRQYEVEGPSNQAPSGDKEVNEDALDTPYDRKQFVMRLKHTESKTTNQKFYVIYNTEGDFYLSYDDKNAWPTIGEAERFYEIGDARNALSEYDDRKNAVILYVDAETKYNILDVETEDGPIKTYKESEDK